MAKLLQRGISGCIFMRGLIAGMIGDLAAWFTCRQVELIKSSYGLLEVQAIEYEQKVG